MNVTDETTRDTLMELWRNLRNDISDRQKVFVCGAISFAFSVGLLNLEQRELWQRRIETCPGHDDEGGRYWCAYCGGLDKGEDGQGG